MVASALNVNDKCLTSIAAVHLKIPDLPDVIARDNLEAADAFVKYGDWNPALHPRRYAAEPRMVRAHGWRRNIFGCRGCAKRQSEPAIRYVTLANGQLGETSVWSKAYRRTR